MRFIAQQRRNLSLQTIELYRNNRVLTEDFGLHSVYNKLQLLGAVELKYNLYKTKKPHLSDEAFVIAKGLAW